MVKIIEGTLLIKLLESVSKVTVWLALFLKLAHILPCIAATVHESSICNAWSTIIFYVRLTTLERNFVYRSIKDISRLYLFLMNNCL